MNFNFKPFSTVLTYTKKYIDKFDNMNQEELIYYIKKSKKRFSKEKNKEKLLNTLIPKIFACTYIAAKRTLAIDAFDVQIEGAYHLNLGKIIEMHTGEGKTFTCVFTAVLNSLAGNVHIITVNDYLAKRDCTDMGLIYSYLGLTTSSITSDMSESEKREAYKADIVYINSSQIGFDYLRDNQKNNIEDKIVPNLDFCIIDEADSILIDDAKTPLIIAGRRNVDANIYTVVDLFIKSLCRGKDKKVCIEGDELFLKQSSGNLTEEEMEALGDYTVDEIKKSVILTQRGIKKAENFFSIKFKEDPTFPYIIENSLKANFLFKKDKHYVVKNNKVELIDDMTGRVLEGRQYSNGLHQAIEAKENLDITKENITMATITLQSFFRMYRKVSGMTGTIYSSKNEMHKVYNLDVKRIKTNKPCIRVDHPDILFLKKDDKYKYLLALLKDEKKLGQPKLIGTASIKESEEISKMLKKEKIEHLVLNAKQDEKEAEIIAQAGMSGKVTVTTNMAGRGTDILLGGNPSQLAICKMKEEKFSEEELFHVKSINCPEEFSKAKNRYKTLFDEYKKYCDKDRELVIKKGGLFVISTIRNDSLRADNQLRGRSGRQGDVGESIFLVSLEDENLQPYLSTREKTILTTYNGDNYKATNSSFNNRKIRSIQNKIELMHYEERKNLLKYDEVNNEYRKNFYNYRDRILLNLASPIEEIKKFSVSNSNREFFENIFEEYFNTSKRKIKREFSDLSDLQVDDLVYKKIKSLYIHELDEAYIDFLIAIENLRVLVDIAYLGTIKPEDLYRKKVKLYYERLIKSSVIVLREKIKEDTKVNYKIEI